MTLYLPQQLSRSADAHVRLTVSYSVPACNGPIAAELPVAVTTGRQHAKMKPPFAAGRRMHCTCVLLPARARLLPRGGCLSHTAWFAGSDGRGWVELAAPAPGVLRRRQLTPSPE